MLLCVFFLLPLVQRLTDSAPLYTTTPGDAGLSVECYGEAWPVELLERPPVAVGKPAPAVEPQMAMAA